LVSRTSESKQILATFLLVHSPPRIQIYRCKKEIVSVRKRQKNNKAVEEMNRNITVRRQVFILGRGKGGDLIFGAN
jgi:hypothetical protein